MCSMIKMLILNGVLIFLSLQILIKSTVLLKPVGRGGVILLVIVLLAVTDKC